MYPDSGPSAVFGAADECIVLLLEVSMIFAVLIYDGKYTIFDDVHMQSSQLHDNLTGFFSRIVSLFTEQNELQYAVPGGLIGRLFVMY